MTWALQGESDSEVQRICNRRERTERKKVCCSFKMPLENMEAFGLGRQFSLADCSTVVDGHKI